MLIDNIIYYEDHLLLELNQPGSPLYCFFDYDKRSYDINMEFQHFHSFYEIHILLDDNANHIIEGNLFHINKFDILCLKPSLLHKSEYPEGPAIKRLVIQFRFPTKGTGVQSELEQILEIFHTPVPIYRFAHNELCQIFEPLNDIYKIGKSAVPIQNLLIYNRLVAFLSELYLYKEKNRYTPQTSDMASNKIYAITSYIHGHFHEDMSLDALSSLFFISPYHLSHQFHSVTGFTLTNYVQMVRIRNAQQLLLFTDKKISEVAECCGFNSFSQFNRVFNKFCASSPREFKLASGKIGTTYKI